MKNFFTFLLIILGVWTCAECQTVQISGKVTSDNGGALSYVNITVKGTHKGTASDNKGMYTLKNVTVPCTVVFSHVSHKTLEYRIKPGNIKNGTVDLNVTLKHTDQQLQEFTVSASPVHKLERLVYDFEIVDDKMYVTCNKNGNNTLFVYDSNEMTTKGVTVPKYYKYFGWDFAHEGYLSLYRMGFRDYYRIHSDSDIQYVKFDSLEYGIGLLVKNIDKYYQSLGATDTFHSWAEHEYKNGVENVALHPGLFLPPPVTHLKLKKGYSFKVLGPNCVILTTQIKDKTGDIYVLYLNEDREEFEIRRIFYMQGPYEWFYPNSAQQELCDISARILKDFDNTRMGYDKYELNKSFTMLNSALCSDFARKHLPIYCGSDNSLNILDDRCELKYKYYVPEDIFKCKNFQDFQLTDSNYCWIRYNWQLNRLYKIDLHTGKIVKSIKLEVKNAEKLRIWHNKVYYLCPIEQNRVMGQERQLFVQRID